MDCPCVNCICIPICRHKYFVNLKIDCSLVEDYLFEGRVRERRRIDFDERVLKVSLAINPTEWSKNGATFRRKVRAKEQWIIEKSRNAHV